MPSSLADLVTSFESAKQKCESASRVERHLIKLDSLLTFLLWRGENVALRREQDLDSVNQVLEAGLVNIPQPLDAEK